MSGRHRRRPSKTAHPVHQVSARLPAQFHNHVRETWYADPMSHGGADHATMIQKNQMVEGSSVVPAGRHLASKAAGTRVETEEVREIAAKISSNNESTPATTSAHKTRKASGAKSSESYGLSADESVLDPSLDTSVDLSLYAKLWAAGGTGVSPLGDGPNTVFVPHSIIFMHSVPFAWYFSSHIDGRYLRKSKKKLTSEQIFQHFKRRSRVNKLSTSSIVVIWMKNEQSLGSGISHLVSEYFTLAELKHFLFNRDKKGDGLLQEHIGCSGRSRRGIRCEWSPNICSVEMCVNKISKTNKSVSRQRRLADVNGERADIIVSQLDLATKLGARIKSLSDVLAIRLEQVANMALGKLSIDLDANRIAAGAGPGNRSAAASRDTTSMSPRETPRAVIERFLRSATFEQKRGWLCWGGESFAVACNERNTETPLSLA